MNLPALYWSSRETIPIRYDVLRSTKWYSVDYSTRVSEPVVVMSPDSGGPRVTLTHSIAVMGAVGGTECQRPCASDVYVRVRGKNTQACVCEVRSKI